jgi:hypothetical protein
VFGASGGTYATPPRFQVSTSWRYFRSDRHYVGPEFQEVRQDTKSQFVNNVHMVELGFKYTLNDRWSFSGSVPLQRASRNQPLRINGVVVHRFITRASGFADASVLARRWMLRPDTHPSGNFSLGFGMKLPTGNENAQDFRWRLVDGVPTRNDTAQAVDQSIQPGDGGIGYITDLQWFQGVAKGKVTFYGGATYLFSPHEESKAGHSASDQYLGRVGAVFTGSNWKGFALGVGGRLEGVPWADVINSEAGSRRPGYSVSLEPTQSWRKGPHVASVSVPVMQYANRTRNTGDRDNDRGPGDAAFAPFSVSVGYTYRFGKPAVPREYRDEAEETGESLSGTEAESASAAFTLCPRKVELPEQALPESPGL